MTLKLIANDKWMFNCLNLCNIFHSSNISTLDYFITAANKIKYIVPCHINRLNVAVKCRKYIETNIKTAIKEIIKV